jgi:hypothetical protein
MNFLSRQTVPVETQLDNLRTCGIELNSGVTVEDLLTAFADKDAGDEARTEIEASPYEQIIDALGFEKDSVVRDEAGRESFTSTPLSNKLWYWDSESVDDPKAYADAVERLDFISGHVLGLTDFTGDVDFEQESFAYVEFTYKDERVRWNFDVDDDWMSYAVFVNLDALLEKSGSGLRLYGNFENYGQCAVLAAFRDEEYERFRQLSKVTLKRLDTALAAWIESDSRPSPSREDVIAAIETSLAELGFDRCGSDEFTRRISDGVLGYIALDAKQKSSEVEITPWVGVRHHGLSETLCELEQVECGPYLPVSMQASLEELIRPHESFSESIREKRKYGQAIRTGRWDFSDIADLTRLAAGVVEAIRDRALPFFAEHDDLATIVADLAAGRFDRAGEPGYVAAVGLFLLGCPDDALSYMEAQLEETYGAGKRPLGKYRKFVRRLVARMEESAWAMPPEQAARFETLIARPEDRQADDDTQSRVDRFIEALDELLEPIGFSRTGLDWRKDSKYAVFVLSLDAGSLRIWLCLFLKVFRPVNLNKVGVGQSMAYDILIPLTQICPKPVILKLRRAFEFDYDYANSATFEIDDSLTGAEREEITRAMEPETPLTMAWRRAAVRDAVASSALPLFERIETRLLTRLGLALKVFYYGFSLGRY